MADKEKANAYARERYAWLKEHKICVICGKENALGEYVRCPKCLEQHSIYTYKRYHKLKQESGKKRKCLCCSDPAVTGRAKCQRHLDYSRMKMREYRSILK